ncbi:MAG: GxxExxY protein [Bacteroidales bacterium]|jgi:GxxExxY protein|nr:GxxExxY protein [Bacteroidales bacterium]
MTQKYLDGLTYQVIGAAIEVHKELGPGLLESVYEKCLVHLLKEKGLNVTFQQRVPVVFHGFYLECDLRYDLMIENQIIVEVKAVDALLPVHEAQLLTYLKLMQKPKGILLNFNCVNVFKSGQKTLVTELFSQLPKT